LTLLGKSPPVLAFSFFLAIFSTNFVFRGLFAIFGFLYAQVFWLTGIGFFFLLFGPCCRGKVLKFLFASFFRATVFASLRCKNFECLVPLLILEL
jgi:hypothetical protein